METLPPEAKVEIWKAAVTGKDWIEIEFPILNSMVRIQSSAWTGGFRGKDMNNNAELLIDGIEYVGPDKYKIVSRIIPIAEPVGLEQNVVRESSKAMGIAFSNELHEQQASERNYDKMTAEYYDDFTYKAELSKFIENSKSDILSRVTPEELAKTPGLENVLDKVLTALFKATKFSSSMKIPRLTDKMVFEGNEWNAWSNLKKELLKVLNVTKHEFLNGMDGNKFRRYERICFRVADKDFEIWIAEGLTFSPESWAFVHAENEDTGTKLYKAGII